MFASHFRMANAGASQECPREGAKIDRSLIRRAGPHGPSPLSLEVCKAAWRKNVPTLRPGRTHLPGNGRDYQQDYRQGSEIRTIER
jgi:hypothetical protein